MTDADGTRTGGSDDGRATVAGDQDGTALAATFIGRSLGDFHVIREVGRGSMGIVFEAEQRELKRKVALKILPPSLSVTETVIKRFLREAQSVAKLSHDNIVQIFDIGDQDGVFFYAMQFVEGQSLDKVLRQRKLTPKECATIIAAAARAVFFANENGIVHRDIKPGNIILTYKDKPVLTDFGLARPEKGATLTESGALVGTPIYMSPEQVRGDRAQIDRRTDIYSLGVTLYEMLAGRTPYEGTSTQEILRKIEHEEPKPLRSVVAQVPKPLAVITHKAIEKESARRYQTAIEFALDLERYLAGEQIQARPTKFATRIMRRARRHKIIVGLGVALLLAVVGTLIAMSRGRAARRDEANARIEAQTTRIAKLMVDGVQLYEGRDFAGALAKFTEAVAIKPDFTDAHVWRGKCFYRKENSESADAELTTAITQDPNHPSAQLWRGIVRLRYGSAAELTGGLTDLRDSLQRNPDDPDCLREAARLCIELASDAPSQKVREELLDLAQQRLTLQLEKHPSDDDEAWLLQGLLYEVEGATDPTMMKAARASWEKAKQINPQNQRAWALLMPRETPAASSPAADAGADRPRSAVGIPTWWGALAAQGASWASKKMPASTDIWDGAVGALGLGKRGAGGAPPVGAPEIAAVEQLMAEANKSWDEGDRATAAALYRRVIEKDDSIVEVHNRLAEAALDLGNVTEALSHVDSARRLAPTNLRTLTVAMRAYTVVGDRAKMQEVVAIVVHEHPAVLNVPTIREVLAPFLPDPAQPAQSTQPPQDDAKPAGGG